MKILVTGAGGQLAEEIRDYPFPEEYEFVFLNEQQLDITDAAKVHGHFDEQHYDFCVNCAAYTAVDAAEQKPELAMRVNAEGAKNLALAAAKNNTCLIHISTDFVFDGNAAFPRNENHATIPVNQYGLSKLKGEEHITNLNPKHYIIRTSWLYAAEGANFVNTMLRLGKERNELSVVADQIGTPTWTRDLVDLIYCLIQPDMQIAWGTYHYSNEGVASWYDFAHAIFKISNIDLSLKPIASEAYPTPAKRPLYSVMDKTKIKSVIKGLSIPHWRDSLQKCLNEKNTDKQ